LTLENIAVQLHLVNLELRVHSPAIPHEILGVPERGHNLGLDIDLFENSLALSLSLAIFPSSLGGEVDASVEHKEEIV